MSTIDDLPDYLQLPKAVTITLTPMQLLAVAGALRTLDDDMLEDEGVLPGLYGQLQDAFEVIDEETEALFGEDWPTLTSTDERLAEDYSPDAEWDDDAPLYEVVSPRLPTLSGGSVVRLLFPETAE